jgi:hypothetical protein
MCEGWTDQQRKIYSGLKDIGGEAAGFFKSALNYYYNPTQPNSVSHLAHAAREIDGGLRDIFSPKVLKKRTEEELGSTLADDFKDYKGHIASILAALNVGMNDPWAKEWILIATKFHKFAHRHGFWKSARTFDDFKPFWERYELVLIRLVGSYYAIIERLDHLIDSKDISEASVGTVLNLIQINSYANYFLKHVKDLAWFEPLRKNNVFNFPDNEGKEFLFLYSLGYLEWVSMQVSSNPKQNAHYAEELLEIIDHTIKHPSIKKNRYVIWNTVKILNNLPVPIIEANLRNKYDFNLWLTKWAELLGGDLTVSEIGKDLLGKFLNYDLTIKYAEMIVDEITRIRPNDKKSSFGKDSAVLRQPLYWVGDSFIKYNKKISERCSPKTIIGIATKLNKALEYKQREYFVYVEIENDFYRLGVSRIPINDQNKEDIDYKENAYSCSIKKFTENQIKGIDREKILWTLAQIDSPEVLVGEFLVDADCEGKFVEFVKAHLPTGINWTSCIDLDKKLKFLFDGLFEDYSYVWYENLGMDCEGHSTDAEEVLSVILRDILCLCDSDQVKKILNEFLATKYPFSIFKRFVLFFVNRDWDQYGQLLSLFLDLKPNPLHGSDYGIELYDVFLNQNAHFDEKLKEKIQGLINDVPEYYVQEGVKGIAYWQHKWLSPLKDNSSFTDAFRKAKERAEPKDGKDYVPFQSNLKGGIVVHKSSLSKNDILNKPIPELIQYFKIFKAPSFWDATFEGEPDKEGLAQTLQGAVKENPKKFINEIELFNEDGLYLYVNHILSGFRDVWREGNSLDWEKVLGFCLSYIQQRPFMRDAAVVQGEDIGRFKREYVWLIDTIVGLIQDGSQDDKRAFENSNFGMVERIFDALLQYVQGEQRPDTQRSAINYAINTTLGKLIESYIIYSLHVARVYEKPREWGRNKYERFFEKGIEAYIFLGRYIMNLRFLDQAYIDQKIADFGQGALDEYQWPIFMEAYLCSAHLPKILYSAMRAHYLKAIEYGRFEGKIDEMLVEHICIGYLHYGELLQENNEDGQLSLFWKMLQRAGTIGKPRRWIRVAGFFWAMVERPQRQKNYDEEGKREIRKKALKFWTWTYRQRDQIKNILGDVYGEFFADMARLTVILDGIDDEKMQWILLSVSYMEQYHQSTFLIEYLAKFEDKPSIERVGKIYLELLKYGTPIFKQEDIKVVVEKLYKYGLKADADTICNIYGQRGSDFLKEIWKANQQGQTQTA